MNWALARQTLWRSASVAAACCAVGSVALVTLGLLGSGATTREFARWPFIDMWVRWDAGWYQAIATVGHYFSSTEQSTVAYFPLYPLLMGGAVRLGANVFLAGIALTFVCGMTALVLFRQWGEQQSDAPTAARAWAVLALWPFAYYLYGAIYSDALFLALAVGAFSCLERGQLWRATVLGALASATRPVGPAIVLGLLVRQLELRRRAGQPWRRRDFVPVLSAAGFAAYMAYLGLRFGDPLAFLSTQAGWSQAPGTEWLGKFALAARLAGSPHPEDVLLPVFHLGLTALLVAGSFAARRQLGWGYAAYTWVVLGLPLIATRDFISLGRYGLAAFPSFLMVGRWLATRPRLRRAYWVATAALLAWMVSKFAMGRYVA
jgi:hypothetical protein